MLRALILGLCVSVSLAQTGYVIGDIDSIGPYKPFKPWIVSRQVSPPEPPATPEPEDVPDPFEGGATPVEGVPDPVEGVPDPVDVVPGTGAGVPAGDGEGKGLLWRQGLGDFPGRGRGKGKGRFGQETE